VKNVIGGSFGFDLGRLQAERDSDPSGEGGWFGYDELFIVTHTKKLREKFKIYELLWLAGGFIRQPNRAKSQMWTIALQDLRIKYQGINSLPAVNVT